MTQIENTSRTLLGSRSTPPASPRGDTRPSVLNAHADVRTPDHSTPCIAIKGMKGTALIQHRFETPGPTLFRSESLSLSFSLNLSLSLSLPISLSLSHSESHSLFLSLSLSQSLSQSLNLSISLSFSLSQSLSRARGCILCYRANAYSRARFANGGVALLHRYTKGL